MLIALLLHHSEQEIFDACYRRQIQEALNQQTYHQFKSYAEQQYPGNPEQVCSLDWTGCGKLWKTYSAGLAPVTFLHV
jgi:hypothetical protein